MLNGTQKAKEKQALSRGTEQSLVQFLSHLLLKLNKALDCRLVKDFLALRYFMLSQILSCIKEQFVL